jgi:UDP-glucose 4-epimerase
LKLIVTGGAGYIGSHSLIALLQAGHDISVIDDLSNSQPTVLARVEHLSGRRFRFVNANLCDAQAITKEFHQFGP